MNQVVIDFCDELQWFLSKCDKGQEIYYSISDNQSVKHLIEALGVPHTEVGTILVNNIEVRTSYLVQGGDRIEVYSNFPAESKIEGLSQEQSSIEKDGLILDNHLGKLATYLRMFGFDAEYRNDYQDKELVEEVLQSGRILLTRDRGLLMHRLIQKGYCIRSLVPKQQLSEVFQRYNLLVNIQPFRRCLRCNNLLLPINKEAILERLQPLTCLYYDEYKICNSCDQIYWKGSHYESMMKFIEEIKELR